MVEIFEKSLIAKGYNNAAGLINIETISVNGTYFAPIDSFGKWSDGLFERDGTGKLIDTGYASTSWTAGFITLTQWNYLYTNILGGARSGPVTIQTLRYNADYHLICNAILDIGDPPGLNKAVATYNPFTYRFSRLEIIEEEQMYGNIYTLAGSTAQTGITTSAVKLTGFASNGLYSGVTPDASADTLTVAYAGTYRIDFTIAATGTTSTQFLFRARKNGVATSYGCELNFNATPDMENGSFTGYLDLSANDVITIYVESDQGGGASLTPTDMQLSLQRVGFS